MTFFRVKIAKFSRPNFFAKLWTVLFLSFKFFLKNFALYFKNSMVYSKIYGFLPPSKVIDVDDGVAAVGYKSLSTPPLLILNRRTPLKRSYASSVFD